MAGQVRTGGGDGGNPRPAAARQGPQQFLLAVRRSGPLHKDGVRPGALLLYLASAVGAHSAPVASPVAELRCASCVALAYSFRKVSLCMLRDEDDPVDLELLYALTVPVVLSSEVQR